MAVGAVFDCMLFLQAITNQNGPAFRCFALAERGSIDFYLSPTVLAEIEDVLNRPALRLKFPILTPQRVETFLQKFKAVAQLVADPPNFFTLPRDLRSAVYRFGDRGERRLFGYVERTAFK